MELSASWIDPGAGLLPPHPTLQAAGTLTLTQRPAPQKWRGWRGGAGALAPEQAPRELGTTGVGVYVRECAKVQGEAMSV